MIEINEIPKKRNARFGFTTLSTVITFIAMYRSFFIIIMAVAGAVHVNRYTYWNYIGATIFYNLLLLSYIMNRTHLFKILAIFVLPIVFGSVLFVCMYIILILQLDDGELFIAATYIDGGTLSVGTVHTFDHIIHTFPVIDFLILLASGYIKDARHVVHAFLLTLTEQFEKFIFLFYFYIGPLLPFSTYCCFFNPFREYPTDVNAVIPMTLGSIIYIIIMTWVYSVLTTNTYGHFRKNQLGIRN